MRIPYQHLSARSHLIDRVCSDPVAHSSRDLPGYRKDHGNISLERLVREALAGAGDRHRGDNLAMIVEDRRCHPRGVRQPLAAADGVAVLADPGKLSTQTARPPMCGTDNQQRIATCCVTARRLPEAGWLIAQRMLDCPDAPSALITDLRESYRQRRRSWPPTRREDGRAA